jgi:fibro-slime domain-containing protein
MVADTLDSERKPVLGPSPYFDAYLSKWYRPWVAGDYTIPLYTYAPANGVPQGIDTVGADTSFINIVFHDSLPFLRVAGTSRYSYDNSSFFPLDGKGFLNDERGSGANNHNYSFTMEIHTTFTFQTGMTFTFRGDDDVWAFVNNRLAMDIGGIHNASPGSFSVDNLPNLVSGKVYSFDFFFAERHLTASTIHIETNLFTPPGLVQIYHITPDDPNSLANPVGNLDSAFSGTPFNLAAHVFDSTGNARPEYDTAITWTLKDDSMGTVITKHTNDTTTLISGKAYGWVTLTATFNNPSDPNAPVLTKTIQIYIGPGKPNRINIQNSPVITSLRTDQKVGAITLDENTPQYNDLYAVLRDSVGNYIDSANSAQWISSDSLVATVAPSNATKRWQGIVTKVKAGVILIIASEPGVVPDTVKVTLFIKIIPIKKIPSFIVATPAHNPAGPNNPIQDRKVLDFYHNVLQNSGSSGSVDGALIGIQSKAELIQRSSGPSGKESYGDAIVYDAVGNIVDKGLKVYYVAANPVDTSYSYGIYWDCHNKNDRWVGNGTYLIMVSTTDANKLTKTIPIKVGFCR